MIVKLVGHTKLAEGLEPIPGFTECDSIVMYAIAQCYKSKPNPNALKRCLEHGHHSVFEHISFTFDIQDISRTCLAQLTRHRIASYTVESQRYCDYTKKPYRYIVPNTILEDEIAYKAFLEHVRASKDLYECLRKRGVPPQDARFALPEASACNLTFTANARELMHIFDLRLSPAAQWEIRTLAAEMLKQVKPIAPLTFSKYEIPEDIETSIVHFVRGDD